MQRVASVLISMTLALEPVAGKEPITPGHRARVTAGLPQFTFRDSEVTTPCLTSRTYSLLGDQGREGIGKTAQIYPLRPGIEPGTSRL